MSSLSPRDSRTFKIGDHGELTVPREAPGDAP